MFRRNKHEPVESSQDVATMFLRSLDKKKYAKYLEAVELYRKGDEVLARTAKKREDANIDEVVYDVNRFLED